jgi:hypothetical protein
MNAKRKAAGADRQCCGQCPKAEQGSCSKLMASLAALKLQQKET